MKRNLLLLFLIGLPFMMKGQQKDHIQVADSLDRQHFELQADTLKPALSLPLSRPLFLMSAPGFDGCYPWYGGLSGSQWDLHEGFNAQFGMSVSAGFGKYAPKGAGFGQSAAFAYATPLNQRFSFAAGIYTQNMDWGSFHHTDVGLSAVLGFKVNEKLSLYGYATKSLLPKEHSGHMGYFPIFTGYVRDRIGAMAEFKFNENFKMQFSVETSTTPDYGNFILPCVPQRQKMDFHRSPVNENILPQGNSNNNETQRNFGKDRPSNRYR